MFVRKRAAVIGEHRAQRAAFDKIHQHIGRAAFLLQAVAAHDVGVLQARQVLRLAREAAHEHAIFGQILAFTGASHRSILPWRARCCKSWPIRIPPLRLRLIR